MIFIQPIRKNDIVPEAGKQIELGKSFMNSHKWFEGEINIRLRYVSLGEKDVAFNNKIIETTLKVRGNERGGDRIGVDCKEYSEGRGTGLGPWKKFLVEDLQITEAKGYFVLEDIGDGGTDFNPLRNAMLRVACFYAIGVLSAFIHQRIMIYVSQGTLLSLRNDLFGRMESLPLRYFDTHPHGDIMSVYTNDIDTLRQMISQSMPQFLNSIITVVSVLTSMIVLDIPLTVLSLGMIGVMLALTRYLSKFSGKYFHSQQSSIGSLNGYIEEMMTGQKVVKVFCHEDAAIEEFEKRNNKLFENAYNANAFANYMGPANSQLGNLSYVICAIVGGILAINGIGSLTLGKLASFLTFNKSINMPINQLSMQLNSVIMALAGAERIFALLDERAETDDGYVTLVKVETDENGELRETDKKTDIWAWKHPHKADGSITYQKLCGNVDFIGVDFGYNNKKTVLHEIGRASCRERV